MSCDSVCACDRERGEQGSGSRGVIELQREGGGGGGGGFDGDSEWLWHVERT